jgi:hypothetical protein
MHKPTLHRDRTVTIWDVYSQRLTRTRNPSDRQLAALDRADRASVLRHVRGVRPDDVTGTQIRRLRDEAAAAGDDAMVATCDRAIDGSARALRVVADVLTAHALEA